MRGRCIRLRDLERDYISTRMVVETGDHVLIAGFIVCGTGEKPVAVRVLGLSLSRYKHTDDPV